MIYATTARLALRDWRDEDLPLFVAMNADERVMEHFPATLDPAASTARLKAIRAEFDAEGFGLYAIERREDGAFLGFCGLHRVQMPGELSNAVEIGWRLIYKAWGHGYATEAAQACVALAATNGIPELVAFTTLGNNRSQRVMQRLGMAYAGEFDHPALPEGHRLRRHVIYRMETN